MVHFRILPFCLSFIFFTDISAFNFSCSFHSSNPVGNDYEDYTIHDSKDFKWPNNKVPYVFDENTSTNDREVIKEQMGVIEANVPCIKFIEKRSGTEPRKHLRIIVHDRNSCYYHEAPGSSYSAIFVGGRVTNGNRPRIDFISDTRLSECNFESYLKGVRAFVIHELMHVFGIEHTQKRSDRKNYIEVNNSCIQNTDEARYQYEPIKNYPNDSVKAEVPYRCNSVMHYDPKTFSNGCPTMKSISDDCVFGGDEVLPEDWKMLSIHIGCTSTSGQNGCENKDSRCDTWKQHCQGGKYEDWMKDNCCKTCSKGLECKDGDWNCDSDWDWDWN